MPNTTIVFDLVSQLYVACQAAVPAGVLVTDGEYDGQDPGDILMVGVPDPFGNTADSASGQQSWHGLGAKAALEQGTVACCAMSWRGDQGDEAQKAARETVRDIVFGVDAALNADPNLGGKVPGLEWVRYGQNYTLTQPPITGAVAIFQFEIAYQARLVYKP